jgi:hypothetical protein
MISLALALGVCKPLQDIYVVKVQSKIRHTLFAHMHAVHEQ